MSESPETKWKHILRERALSLLPSALAFALGVGIATRQYLPALATGLAVSVAIDVFDGLDRRWLRPRLKKLPYDWLQLGAEIAIGLFDHIAGALLALVLGSLLFNFHVETTIAWGIVAGLVLAFPIIHVTGTALRFYRQVKEKEQLEQQLRVLATEAELKALKAQINPHFLFNTLNTIAQLIHSDSAQAEATVERLAEMLRYTLVSTERGLVPLRDELDFVDHYLQIERARFGERLHIESAVDPAALAVAVPSLILQPLVENAVRHGRADDGRVDLGIRAVVEGETLVVTVADRGPGMQPARQIAAGPGVGLRNVDERLRKSYGEAYGLRIEGNQPRGTLVIVRIPV